MTRDEPHPRDVAELEEPQASPSPLRVTDEQARHRLWELEAVYRTAPIGLCVIDRNLRFVRVNDRLAEINGVSAEDHVGRKVRDVVPGLVEPAERLLRQVMERGEPVLDVEVVGETPARPGEQRIWIESWYPLRDEAGEILGVNVVAQEVTEQRRAEEERRRLLEELERERELLRRAKLEAEEANRAKSLFLTSMSHDLRTPLNAIAGYVDLMEMGIQGPVTEAQKSSLERIRLNQKVLLTLIHDVLHFSKVDAGQLPLEEVSVPLFDMLKQIEPTVAPLAGQKRITYTVEDSDRAVAVRADPERVRQIVMNLVGNAIKYTPSGGSVTIGCARVEDRGEIYVRDDGPGVPEEMQSRIFEPFFQVGRGKHHPGEGIGMGLAISLALARRMGGDLEIESRVGEGSTFRLRLPAA